MGFTVYIYILDTGLEMRFFAILVISFSYGLEGEEHILYIRLITLG